MAVINVDLGYQPRRWQSEFHRNKRQRNVLIAHRRSGKSWAAIMELIDCALSRPGTRYGYIAPQLNQAKAVLWDFLKERACKVPHTKISEAELSVRPPNGSKIRLFGIDNPEPIRGLGFHGLVLDEYADFNPDAWSSVIQPTLMSDKGWLMVLGTPKGLDPLVALFEAHENDPNWYCRKIKASESGVFSPEELAQAKAEARTERAFMREYECDTSIAADDQLMDSALYDAATKRDIGIMDYNSEARILGVDVARQGNDRTVIFRRQGKKAWVPITLNRIDSIEVADIVAAEIIAFEADAVFIDATGGYGGGVTDILRSRGHAVTEVAFNGRAMDPRFKNARAEMWWRMAEWFKEASLPEIQGLKMEIASARVRSNTADNGQLSLDPKSEMKKRLDGSSPDVADALALTFYEPVTKRLHGHQETAVIKDWLDWVDSDEA